MSNSPLPLAVAVPDTSMLARFTPPPPGVTVEAWTPDDEPLDHPIDLLVLPYMGSTRSLTRLVDSEVSVIQSQSLGYDGIEELLPAGVVYCNAVGVHEGSTGELALGLILSAQRGFYESAIAQHEGTWRRDQYEGLGGRSVLLIGIGGVGHEVEVRLQPFGVQLTRMARTAREDSAGPVHAFSALDELLPLADIVVLAVPLSDETRHLADGAFLNRMKPNALLVNVSRGAVVDTDAMVERVASGRLRVALDVTDPEPLPDGHPLWSLPGVLITPHLGGHSKTMPSRIDPVVREQIALLQQGLPPKNMVFRT